MEDKHNDAVSLELGGRLWELKLTHKAMKLFTNTTRVPVTRMDEAVARYDYLVYLLFCIPATIAGMVRRACGGS